MFHYYSWTIDWFVIHEDMNLVHLAVMFIGIYLYKCESERKNARQKKQQQTFLACMAEFGAKKVEKKFHCNSLHCENGPCNTWSSSSKIKTHLPFTFVDKHLFAINNLPLSLQPKMFLLSFSIWI